MYRDDREQYDQKAKETVAASKQDIPEGFEMPKTLNEAPPVKFVDDDDFWAGGGDSEEEDDFGASDSSGEDMEMDEDEEEQEEDDDETAE
jgi:ubiquitin-conjugating enzyme E2 R